MAGFVDHWCCTKFVIFAHCTKLLVEREKADREKELEARKERRDTVYKCLKRQMKVSVIDE